MERPRRYGDTAFAADYLDMPAATLAYWRSVGVGPRWFKLGRRVRYDLDDLDDFIETIKSKASA